MLNNVECWNIPIIGNFSRYFMRSLLHLPPFPMLVSFLIKLRLQRKLYYVQSLFSLFFFTVLGPSGREFPGILSPLFTLVSCNEVKEGTTTTTNKTRSFKSTTTKNYYFWWTEKIYDIALYTYTAQVENYYKWFSCQVIIRLIQCLFKPFIRSNKQLFSMLVSSLHLRCSYLFFHLWNSCPVCSYFLRYTQPWL